MFRKIKSKIRNFSYFYQWDIQIDFENEEEFSTSFSRFKKLSSPKDTFWADPFVIKKEEKWYVFFEEYLNSNKRGHLSVITIDKQNISEPIKILERDYHLSFPSIFEFEEELYLIHGTNHNLKSYVELFKCENFPLEWVHHSTLIHDISLVDTIMFYFNKKWWLFGCKGEKDGSSKSEELMLFYSDNPLSTEWNSHPMNPIIKDITKARPAGQIFIKDNKIIRPAQNCFKVYGNGISFNEITKINENEYEEKQIEVFSTDWNNDLIGLHTFNFHKGCTVIDTRSKYKKIKNNI